MHIGQLVVKEVLHRKLHFALGLFSVTIAVACLVGALTLLRAHDMRTDQIIALKEAGFYAHHSSCIVGGDGLDWVAASGCEGISELELALGTEESVTCTVGLHFAEPTNTKPGRGFGVSIEGKPVFTLLDVFTEAGGRNRSLVKRFEGIQVDDGKLTVEFVSPFSSRTSRPLLCGIEVTVETKQ